MSDYQKRIGILWGGGLGDLLIIRPFLIAVQANPKTRTYLMTTASHLTELFEELCSPTEIILLPRQPGQLWPIIKRWRHSFDLIYLGPRPTAKTRLLGHLLAPGKLWNCHHSNVHPYLLEQIFADINVLGFSGEADDRNITTFLPWEVDNQHNPFKDALPFFVLHPGVDKPSPPTCQT